MFAVRIMSRSLEVVQNTLRIYVVRDRNLLQQLLIISCNDTGGGLDCVMIVDKCWLQGLECLGTEKFGVHVVDCVDCLECLREMFIGWAYYAHTL